MSAHIQLFEFLCTLTDIQIKKYVSLATFGIGPDARLNAKLVFNEVNELLEFSNQLLLEMESNPENHSNFIKIFNQVKFYMEQEHIRSYAGWLLAENNIHSTVNKRVVEQLEELNNIAKSIDLDTSLAVEPTTDVQKQCEHDSVAIAFRILDLALQIQTNPEMDIKIPRHALDVLRNNAKTRYVQFSEEITELHANHDIFLKKSDLEKNSTILEAEEAKTYEAQHKTQWDCLLKRYHVINPVSKLFSSDYEWYNVGVNSQPKISKMPIKHSQSLYSSKNLALFSGGIAVASILLVYMLMQYFADYPDDHTAQSTMKFQ